MDASVSTLVREHRSLELGIGSAERFKRSLKSFQDRLKEANRSDIDYLLDVHYEVLTRVKQFIKTNYMGDAAIKRLHDDIFINRLLMPKNKTTTVVTKVFEEFIKGFNSKINSEDF